MWLKADAGTNSTTDATAITNWNDQSSAGTDFVDGPSSPKYLNNAINYNPTVNFTSDYMQPASNPTTKPVNNNDDFTIFSVSLPASNYLGFSRGEDGHGNGWSIGSKSVVSGSGFGTQSNVTGITISNNVATLGRLVWDRGTSLNGAKNGLDGTGNYSVGSPLRTSTVGFRLGRQNTNYANANIAEIITYNSMLSSNKIQKVESYLAIKYGITKIGDYIASNGTTLWNSTTNATYHNDITGIGRDDNSALDQQKSLSVNSDGMVIMDKGGTFGTDLNFILWGNDNASTTLGIAELVPGYDQRMPREWKVAVNGTPGTVTLRMIVTGNTGLAGNYALHVDDDGDFAGGNTTNYTATSISGDTITFNNVSIADGNFFTVGYAQKGPGGITSNLQLWLKADAQAYNDAGTTLATTGQTVREWYDQSGNNRKAIQGTAGNRSTYYSNGVNFNPVNRFDGSDKYTSIYDVSTTSTANHSIFTVFAHDHDGTGNPQGPLWSLDGSTSNSGFFPMYSDGNQYLYRGGGFLNQASAFTRNEWYVSSVLHGTNSTELWRNGVLNHNIGTNTVTEGGFDIGLRTTLSKNYGGDIAEMIVYSYEVSAADRNKIESYLAIKYGITIDNTGGGTIGDYTSSSGTNLWDASDYPSYHNDVIVIGRDAASALYQKQSKTSDDSLIVYTDALTTTNSANAGAITADNSFVVIGHNDGKLQGVTNEKPGSVYSRLEREWKVTNTGFTDDFNIQLEWDSIGTFNITDIILLVDDDGDFSDATIYDSEDGLTFSNGSIIVEGINNFIIPVNATRFFTLGSVSSNTPLPVELLSFTASPTESNSVILNWKTALEHNNESFTIERSLDILTWVTVTTVNGAGNYNDPIDYSTIDTNPFEGISYYRLKQTDYNSVFQYSEIKTINLTKPNDKIKIYPNPTDGLITIEGVQDEQTSIFIYNAWKENLTHLTKERKTKESSIIIDIKRLNRGVYFLHINGNIVKILKE